MVSVGGENLLSAGRFAITATPHRFWLTGLEIAVIAGHRSGLSAALVRGVIDLVNLVLGFRCRSAGRHQELPEPSSPALKWHLRLLMPATEVLGQEVIRCCLLLFQHTFLPPPCRDDAALVKEFPPAHATNATDGALIFSLAGIQLQVYDHESLPLQAKVAAYGR